MTEFDAVKAVYMWQYASGDNFTHLLLNLFAKADVSNYARLNRGFPELGRAFGAWRDSNDPDDFFKSYGISHSGTRLVRRAELDHMCPRLNERESGA